MLSLLFDCCYSVSALQLIVFSGVRLQLFEREICTERRSSSFAVLWAEWRAGAAYLCSVADSRLRATSTITGHSGELNSGVADTVQENA